MFPYLPLELEERSNSRGNKQD